MHFKILLLIAGSVGFASADLTTVGSCSVNVEPLSTFNLDQFASENRGVWSVKLVPHTPDYNRVSWMFISNNPIADSGIYQTEIFYEKVNTEPSELADLILFDTGNGIIQAKPVYSNDTFEYRIFFLAYEPGSYAYYYICSDGGADDAVDYRFVVSHDRLKPEERDKIKDLESDFEFKGTLRYLTEGETNAGSYSPREPKN